MLTAPLSIWEAQTKMFCEGDKKATRLFSVQDFIQPLLDLRPLLRGSRSIWRDRRLANLLLQPFLTPLEPATNHPKRKSLHRGFGDAPSQIYFQPIIVLSMSLPQISILHPCYQHFSPWSKPIGVKARAFITMYWSSSPDCVSFN